MNFRHKIVRQRSLFFIVQNVALSRNRIFLDHLKDNMKMYRSINCQITILLTMDEADPERLKREENYPFSVMSINESGVELADSRLDLSGNRDRILATRDDVVILNTSPESEEERFDIKRIVSALLE